MGNAEIDAQIEEPDCALENIDLHLALRANGYEGAPDLLIRAAAELRSRRAAEEQK